MATMTHDKAFKFLTEDQVRQLAPSAFTNKLSSLVTDEYVPIYTDIALRDLAAHGWFPVNAYEVKPKKDQNKGYQKHFIHLRNAEEFVGTESSIELIPEAILINSYGARTPFILWAGMYRPACGNSLIVQSFGIDEIRISHDNSNGTFKKGVQHLSPETYQTLVDNIQKVVNIINIMRGVTLTHFQAKAIAAACCKARWDYKYQLSSAKELLEPLRPDDESNDLWTVFNRIQEKMIKGGWIGAGDRKVKPLVDPNRASNVNKKLFHVAEEFLYQLLK